MQVIFQVKYIIAHFNLFKQHVRCFTRAMTFTPYKKNEIGSNKNMYEIQTV